MKIKPLEKNDKKIIKIKLLLLLILLIIVTFIFTAGGVVVWEKKISPPPIPQFTPPINPYEITPFPTVPPTKIVAPTVTVGEPVIPGVVNIKDLPTVPPFDITEYYCQTDADCYDEQGKPKGLCEVPCQGKPVCRDGLCVQPGIPGMR